MKKKLSYCPDCGTMQYRTIDKGAWGEIVTCPLCFVLQSLFWNVRWLE